MNRRSMFAALGALLVSPMSLLGPKRRVLRGGCRTGKTMRGPWEYDLLSMHYVRMTLERDSSDWRTGFHVISRTSVIALGLEYDNGYLYFENGSTYPERIVEWLNDGRWAKVFEQMPDSIYPRCPIQGVNRSRDV